MVPDDGAGIEVAELEVGVVGAELLAEPSRAELAMARALRIMMPACLASTGSRSGPKAMIATNAINAISASPTPNTAQTSRSE